MVTALIHSAKVYQMYGYTNATWYGYMGWGTGDYFFKNLDRYSFAEAFFAANQSLIFELENLKLDKKDLKGHLYDKNAVAFYGDPAWDARLEKPKNPEKHRLYEQTLSVNNIGNNQYRIRVKITMNKNGKIKRHPVAFLPFRIKNPKNIASDAEKEVIMDNFVLMYFDNALQQSETKELVFECEKIFEENNK